MSYHSKYILLPIDSVVPQVFSVNPSSLPQNLKHSLLFLSWLNFWYIHFYQCNSLRLSSNNIHLVQVVAVVGLEVVAVAGSGVMKWRHFLQMPWSSYVTIFQSCHIVMAEASSSSFALSSVMSVLLSVDCHND